MCSSDLQVRFVTHSLRYNEMAWVRVDRLARHWEHSRVEATLSPGDNTIAVTTANVTALTLDIPSGLSPFEPRREIKVTLDGDRAAVIVADDRELLLEPDLAAVPHHQPRHARTPRVHPRGTGQR